MGRRRAQAHESGAVFGILRATRPLEMSAPPRTTVLVTGSQGKVGRHVVKNLEARGIHVVGVDIVRGEYDTWRAGGGFPELVA